MLASYSGLVALLLLLASPAVHASTYVEEEIKCPVGGEKFKYMGLASISQWGALPDGMPLGSGRFPTLPPQCPSNGLVLFRDFTPAEVQKLAAWVSSAEYKTWRAEEETPYYLAYQTARFLGEDRSYWLLLSATWEAKSADPASAQTKQYNEEFVAAIRQVAADPTNMESIVARLRAVNALRELGRFDEAESMRAAIEISPTAGGTDNEAAENRAGWASFMEMLAAPIARREANRAPIDVIGEREAIHRCLAKEAAERFKQPAPPPLSEFETAYCAKSELAASIKEQRTWLMDGQN